MIPVDSIVTYVGQWPHATFNTPTTSVTNVIAALAKNGLMSVAAPRIEDSFFGALTHPPIGVTLYLKVENGKGYADEGDVTDIIRHEVYQEIGAFPLSDDTPYIQYAGDSTANPTMTAPKVNPKDCVSGGSNDVSGSFNIGCWFKNLTTQGLSTVGVLALVAVAGIGLLFWASGKARV